MDSSATSNPKRTSDRCSSLERTLADTLQISLASSSMISSRCFHGGAAAQLFPTLDVPYTVNRFGTKRVKANTVYQEFIQDKHHQHMNSTRWVTLTEFVKHLGRTGVARVDETEKGWFIAWIDNSPKALEKQASSHRYEVHS